jgi:CheY-like chemotaxis protein
VVRQPAPVPKLAVCGIMSAFPQQRDASVGTGRLLQGAAASGRGGIAVSKFRVLIVDDEPDFLSGLWGLFGETYTLFTATNAETALQILARERKIGLIVTDYQMPGMDGLALLVKVKTLYPQIVRVLMTAYADMALVVRALNEGEIHRFIAKPYRAPEFRKILEECRDLAAIAASRSTAGGGKTILVAHDSVACQAVLRMLLTPAYEVLTTANGIEAVNILAHRHVDAIVLGIGLALLDGCTIASYLKREQQAKTPVVFWSGDIEAPVEQYLEECGADLVLDHRNPDSLTQLQRFLAKKLC